jgi:hypothetical protein
MTDETRTRLIELFMILCSKPVEPRGFVLDPIAEHRSFQWHALRTIYRNYRGERLVASWVSETDRASGFASDGDDLLLRGIERAPKVLLALQREHESLERETQKQKYQRQNAELDPWLEGSQLTGDALGLRPDPEPEPSVKLDEKRNVLRNE